MRISTTIITGLAAVFVTTAFGTMANAAVLAFGDNSGGRTGLGTFTGYPHVPTPIVPTNLAGRRIIQTAGGNWHTLLLAHDGAVFSFGEGDYGETGLGANDDVAVATPIVATNLGGRKVKQVAAGHSISLLLAEDGSVFSFGRNHGGQLGQGTLGDPVTIATPIDGSNLGGRKITQVAGGDRYGLLLADDGSVFAFGDNTNGRTGLGITSGNTATPTQIDATNLGGRRITQVVASDSAGDAISLLLADDGSVF
jgi:alpha-tubulin suppressor-like RCC1 family protein